MRAKSLSAVFVLFPIVHGIPYSPLRRQSSSEPVISSNFQDPCVLQVDDTWYAFSGPNSNPTSPPSNVQVATSPDFSSWSVLGGIDALPDPGPWAASPPRVWAPDVTQLSSGQFIMYYSASLASSARFHCVGAATASSVTGPYTPLSEPLFCDTSIGGAIDSNSVKDIFGEKMYVVYKVDGNAIGRGGACGNTVPPIVPTPIILHEVSAIDGVTLIGEGIQLLTNTVEDGPMVEAPTIFYDGSQWVLFYNSGCFVDPSYRVRYATSDNIIGPYTRRGTFLETGSTAANVQAPGGIDVTSDGTKAVFHGDLNLVWLNGDSDGSPRVRGMYAIKLDSSGGNISPGAFL